MPKNIVICCDGTGNEYGLENTNVLKLYSILEKSDQQQTFYNPGVGTLAAPSLLSKVGKEIHKIAGKAFGTGIISDIEKAYTFLMNCYEHGDRVFIFGFSRGAYAARALAGLICKCGLLDRGNENLVPYAIKVFRHENRPRVYRGFRKSFSRRCKIYFLGLWDTVSSVGWIYNPISLQFTANNPIVFKVRHAVSIDERRAFFRQNLWGEGRPRQNIKQVWFSGVHSDVGGSYPLDESGPSDIALDWMINEALPQLEVNQKRHARVLPISSISLKRGKIHESLERTWWLAEFLPRSYRDRSRNWEKRYKFYLGSKRYIPQGSTIHQSVLDRMEESTYRPTNLPEDYKIEPWNRRFLPNEPEATPD